eukprot:TRINITY_DN7477_c0_g1_i2.p1 TRINITY_DN7477_c0_g1~~TRINITY_DN7477_c0_g1_i2.p1  ORF type:complete len:380 (-),score=71.80 TRINITY_DN7477_c0_g1_i2:453-1592(-)
MSICRINQQSQPRTLPYFPQQFTQFHPTPETLRHRRLNFNPVYESGQFPSQTSPQQTSLPQISPQASQHQASPKQDSPQQAFQHQASQHQTFQQHASQQQASQQQVSKEQVLQQLVSQLRPISQKGEIEQQSQQLPINQLVMSQPQEPPLQVYLSPPQHKPFHLQLYQQQQLYRAQRYTQREVQHDFSGAHCYPLSSNGQSQSFICPNPDIRDGNFDFHHLQNDFKAKGFENGNVDLFDDVNISTGNKEYDFGLEDETRSDEEEQINTGNFDTEGADFYAQVVELSKLCDNTIKFYESLSPRSLVSLVRSCSSVTSNNSGIATFNHFSTTSIKTPVTLTLPTLGPPMTMTNIPSIPNITLNTTTTATTTTSTSTHSSIS